MRGFRATAALLGFLSILTVIAVIMAISALAVASSPGDSPTVSVGTVANVSCMTPASVVNVGTSSAAILNFLIPDGCPGESGVCMTPCASGENATINITVINSSNSTTNATEIIYNTSQYNIIINVSENVTFISMPGPAGANATITIGTTTATANGTNATVINVGSSTAAILDFTLPRGIAGITGVAGGTGSNATIAVGTTVTTANGTNATVTNVGTSSAAVFDFTLPRGQQGPQGAQGPMGENATILIGNTTTTGAGTNATVVNAGNTTVAILNFSLPVGVVGIQGIQGVAGNNATVTVGNTTTTAAGTTPTVVNAGTSATAVLNFTIPVGPTGEIGPGLAIVFVDTSNGSVALSLPTNPAAATITTYRLLYQWGDNAIITATSSSGATFGTVQLTPDINSRTFYWDTTTNVNNSVYRILGDNGVTSFYPTTQQGLKLVGTGNVGNALQGVSVAVSADGNTMATIGQFDNTSSGAVWVYTRSFGVWSQQGAKLTVTGNIGKAGLATVSLSADGNLMAVGGQTDNSGVGATWIFTRSGAVWTQQTKLVGTGNVGNSLQGGDVGLSLEADASTLAVGGPQDNSNAGAVWIFTMSSGVWTQQGAKLVASDGVLGPQFGYSVALSADGNTLAVGGPQDNNGTGAAWIFTRTNATWTQVGSKLVSANTTINASFGVSVAISAKADTVVVGAYNDTGGVGAVWTFFQTGPGIWLQLLPKLVATGAIGSAWQGYFVSLSADGYTLAVSAPQDNGVIGALFVFTYSTAAGGAWIQQAKLVPSDHTGAATFSFNNQLSADGNTIAIGGPTNNANAGAVWIFT